MAASFACASLNLRCDREVRCETGAAPATVSGEPAATATGWVYPAGKAPRATTPSQETSASREVGRFLGRRRRPLPHARGRTRLPPVTLVLGGARSGKSRMPSGSSRTPREAAPIRDRRSGRRRDGRAHRRASGAPRPVLANGRGALALAPAIAAQTEAERPVLVDCLTLWLSNLLLPAGKPTRSGGLCSACERPPAPSCSSATRSGWASSPRRRSAGDFAMPQAASTRMSQRWPTVSCSVAAGLPVSCLKER